MSDVITEEIKEPWWWAEKTRSSRLDYLRKAAWSKAASGGDYVSGVRFSVEKVYWYTKSFKETEGLPWVIRRAKALAALLGNMPVFIVDHAQLVGYHGERPNMMLLPF